MEKATAKQDFFLDGFFYYEGSSINIKFKHFNPDVHQLENENTHKEWTERFEENQRAFEIKAGAAIVREKGIQSDMVRRLLGEIESLKSELGELKKSTEVSADGDQGQDKAPL